jgi:hypothetical protein
MAESGGNYRRIGRKSGVGSAELPAEPPAIRPEIGVFDFIFTNRRSSSANFIQFANIRLKFGESHTVKQNKQIN